MPIPVRDRHNSSPYADALRRRAKRSADRCLIEPKIKAGAVEHILMCSTAPAYSSTSPPTDAGCPSFSRPTIDQAWNVVRANRCNCLGVNAPDRGQRPINSHLCPIANPGALEINRFLRLRPATEFSVFHGESEQYPFPGQCSTTETDTSTAAICISSSIALGRSPRNTSRTRYSRASASGLAEDRAPEIATDSPA